MKLYSEDNLIEKKKGRRWRKGMRRWEIHQNSTINWMKSILFIDLLAFSICLSHEINWNHFTRLHNRYQFIFLCFITIFCIWLFKLIWNKFYYNFLPLFFFFFYFVLFFVYLICFSSHSSTNKRMQKVLNK